LECANRIVYAEWAQIEGQKGKQILGFADHLIHGTAKSKGKYPEFDQRFYKFPSYLRRAVNL